jgi:signal transduction histidine kinase
VGSVTRHDIQNQLTAVIGYNELLTMIIEDPKSRGFLEKERQAVDKIRRQLAFSKIYQNIGMEVPRWQPIRAAVNSARDEVNLKSVNLVVDVGNAAVCADPLFEKAISNLLDNSVRHGMKVTEIRLLLKSGSTEHVLIVEDNGNGIPADEKMKIFERGFGKRTGWGLFVVREILAVTGMTIVETGQPGTGALFEIHIPLEKIRYESS